MIVNRLSELFKASGLNKAELAKKCNISRPTVDNALNGGNIQVETLESFAKVFDVPVGYFFDEEPILSGHSAHVKGNNNVLVGGSNHGTINKLNECEREVEILRVEVKHLTSQVEEKERLIQVLMKNQ